MLAQNSFAPQVYTRFTMYFTNGRSNGTFASSV